MGGAVFPPCYLKWSEVKSLSPVWLFATPWTVANQAPPSMEFSRQEYWSGLPFPGIYLGPNYGWGNEDNGDLPQKIPSATVLAHNPAAGHHRPMASRETPRHLQASPGQFPVGSRFLSPGSWYTRFCCALQESVSQSCVSSGSSMVWVNGNLLQDPDAGKDWRWEKGMKEDEMVGWHHGLNGHEFK